MRAYKTILKPRVFARLFQVLLGHLSSHLFHCPGSRSDAVSSSGDDEIPAIKYVLEVVVGNSVVERSPSLLKPQSQCLVL